MKPSKQILPSTVSTDRKVISVSPDKKTILVALVNSHLIGTPIPLYFSHEGRRYLFVERLRQIPREIFPPETIYSLNKYQLVEESQMPQKPKPQTTPDPDWDTHRNYRTPLSRF